MTDEWIPEGNPTDLRLDAVPPHYLRANKRTTTPRHLIVFDTEAHRLRTDDGEDQTWRCGVASYDRFRTDHGHLPRTEWAEFAAGPDEFWLWVDSHTYSGETTWAVCHNLTYDAVIAQAWEWLPRLGWEMAGMAGDQPLYSMLWRHVERFSCDAAPRCKRPSPDHEHTRVRRLRLVNSFGWWATSLDRIGELIGRHKGRMPAPAARNSRWLAYCRRDVEVLRDAVLRLVEFVGEHDLGRFSFTAAGQAWAAYRHRFMGVRPFVHRNPDILALERQALSGGRCEVFRHGRHDDGPFYYWDVDMAYAQVMATTELPYHLVRGVRIASWADYTEAHERHAVLADVTVTVDEPLVPVRGPTGYTFPVGTHRTQLWDPELDLLQAAGAEVTWHRAYLYRRGPILRDFARWCWSHIHGDDAGDDELMRSTIKHWARAIVGKFGQRNRRWERMWPEPTDYVGQVTTHYEGEARPRTGIALAGWYWERHDDGETENSVPAIAGYVASATRARLWGMMNAAGRGNVLYVDTDGMILTPAGAENFNDAAESRRFGQLSLRGAYESITLWGSKDLKLDGQLHNSALPRRATPLGNGRYRTTVWADLATQVAAGRLTEYMVRTRTIRLRRRYRRGWLLDDGRAVPLELEHVAGKNRLVPWGRSRWARRGDRLSDPRQRQELSRAPP